MGLADLFTKFWVKDKLEAVEYQESLALTDLSDFSYDEDNRESRIFTVDIYNNEDTDNPVKIISDDGEGNLEATTTGILSTATGDESTVTYATSKMTLNWNSTYLSSLTNNPFIKYKIVSATRENHLELIDFLGETFDEYKADELDDREKFYDPVNIPVHLIDTLAKDHNWVVDRFYSDDEAYLRRQLRFLYDLYRSKRKEDFVLYAVSILNRRVNFYNLVAKRGSYNDYAEFVVFDTRTMFQNFEDVTGTTQDAVASQIQDVYDELFDNASQYFPSKHFLLDVALDRLTEESELLDTKDLRTLETYVLRIKSTTQYPHFQSYLGLEADATLTSQSAVPFDFKLTTAESLFTINSVRVLYTGPSDVQSIAQFSEGAWVTLPLIMNNGYQLNKGLLMNMTIGDIDSVLASFRIGKDSHDTMTTSLGALKDPFFTSSNITIEDDGTYNYITLTLDEDEGNDYPIEEVGIYNDQGTLAFYIKHPAINKNDSHKHRYRIKVLTSGVL